MEAKILQEIFKSENAYNRALYSTVDGEVGAFNMQNTNDLPTTWKLDHAFCQDVYEGNEHTQFSSTRGFVCHYLSNAGHRGDVLADELTGGSWEVGIHSTTPGPVDPVTGDTTTQHALGEESIWEFHPSICGGTEGKICFYLRNNKWQRNLYAQPGLDMTNGFGGSPPTYFAPHDQRWFIELV